MNEPFCRCQGSNCEHHAEGEICENAPIPPIAHVVNMKTGTPIAGSASGLCEECWEQHIKNEEAKRLVD